MAADSEGKGTELVPAEQVESGRGDDPDEQLELFPLLQAQLDIERQRVENYDRRTEMAREAIQASNAADERQYEVHMRRLKNEENSSQRRHELARRIVHWGGIAALLAAALLLAMLFFGDETQIESARDLIGVLGIALGGGGVLFLLQRAVRWLFKH